MAITISGTDGIVGAGFTVDASGVSVTAGVGTFSSIGAGASVSAAGLTGTLPTISAANCTNIPAANITGTLPAISGANLTGITAGITMANKWHLTGNFNLTNAAQYYTITGTWQESTAAGYNTGKLGSSMTESSGVFTFPSTGIYYIVYDCITGTSSDQLNMWSYITVGSDNTSTDYLSVKASSGDAGTMNTVTGSALLDVTNTSTQKVFFRGYAASTGCYVSGNSNGNRSCVNFIRLGDT